MLESWHMPKDQPCTAPPLPTLSRVAVMFIEPPAAAESLPALKVCAWV